MSRVRHNRRYYARGYNALAYCERSGQKMFYRDLVEDGHVQGLKVHPAWYEPRHPQELPVDTSDGVPLWKPAPERSTDGGNIAPPANPDTSYICNANLAVQAETGDTFVIVDTPVSFEYGDPVWIELDDTTYFATRAASWGDNVTRIELQEPIVGGPASIGRCVYTELQGTGQIASWEDTILALSPPPDNLWMLAETSTDATSATGVTISDTGAGTAHQLKLYSASGQETNATTNYRGAIRTSVNDTQGAIFFMANATFSCQPLVAQTSIPWNGTTTGGGCFWYYTGAVGTTPGSQTQTLFEGIIQGNSGWRYTGFYDQANNRFTIRVGGTSSPAYLRHSSTGWIEAGKWQLIGWMQDGAGIKLYKNGVEDTGASDQFGNGATTATWLDEIWQDYPSPTYAEFAIGPVGTGTMGDTVIGLQGFAHWTNATITGAQMLELYNAADLDGNTFASVDYYDYVHDYFYSDAEAANLQSVVSGHISSRSIAGELLNWTNGSFTAGSTINWWSSSNFFDAPNARDVSFGAAPRPNSKYRTQACHFDDPAFNEGLMVTAGGANPNYQIDHTATTGTLIAWLKPSGATSITGERIYFSYGQGVTVRILECWITDDRFGWRVASNTGVQAWYSEVVSVSADARYKLVNGNWYMLAVVQDGTGAKLYLNDINDNSYIQVPDGDIAVVQNDPGLDDTSWLAAANPNYSGTTASISGRSGSPSTLPLGDDEGYDFFQFLWTKTALTQTQLTNLWTSAIRTI